MNYLQFDFKTSDEINSDMLVAVLSNNKFDGFEETVCLLKAFIPEKEFEEEIIVDLENLFPGLQYSKSLLKNINWNAEWEANFLPVIIDDFVGIRAHFHLPLNGVTYEIIITPKMSFGTGHHSTTHMMVLLMKEIDFSGKSVIDFGTGTGVLAILAGKAGADRIVALDNDEWSIENAKENFWQNETREIELLLADTLPKNSIFDIIIANINLNIILQHMKSLAESLSDGGTLLLSGFLSEDLAAIKKALILNNLSFVNNITDNNWIAVRATKNN